MSSRQVLFIHGMYMTPLCWDAWRARFADRGFQTQTPGWVSRSSDPQVLRNRHPDRSLGRLTLASVLDDYRSLMAALPDKPILIGHSMGGLIVQLLLQEGLAHAAVAIDSAPPMGVFTTKFTFLKANWPHLSPFARPGHPVKLSFKQFRYAFVNELPEMVQREAFERHCVPESRRI
ncbi:MAG: esterase/lipase family protein, partial [Casimicrobium sp.]